MKDSNILFISAASDISTSSACCLFPVTLLACSLRASPLASANSLAWSVNLLVLVSCSFPFCTIFAARSASSRLTPIGRWHSFRKNSTVTSCIKKTLPEMRAFVNCSQSSSMSSPGRFRLIHSCRAFTSFCSISSLVDSGWLACLSIAVDRTMGRRRIKRSESEHQQAWEAGVGVAAEGK